MTRSKRMQKLVKLAQTDEKQAADRLASSLREMGEFEERLLELRRHREEYMQMLQNQGQQSMNAAQMCDFRRFVANLDRAISQLEQQLDLKDKINEQHRQDWYSNHHRVNALDEIRLKYHDAESRYEEGKLQTEMDERSQHKNGKGTGHD